VRIAAGAELPSRWLSGRAAVEAAKLLGVPIYINGNRVPLSEARDTLDEDDDPAERSYRPEDVYVNLTPEQVKGLPAHLARLAR
jgi:hypothetical protein